MDQNNGIAVSVNNLEKKFGDFTAVNKINFDVKRGEVFGFLGPNGAGKSTTIKMLCGILVPTKGDGQVGGYDIKKQQNEIKRNIGYMSQRFSLYDDLTVGENIDFYSGIYKIPRKNKIARKEWIIKMAGLEGLAPKLTKTLSGGWKQRLALGCAIIHEPKIIFLDEPTSGVDPIARRKFWVLIKDMAKEGVTVFVTTHYMDEAENCDRMALIYKGDIIAIGTPRQLKTEFMKHDVLEVIAPNPDDWVIKLMEIDGIKEAALFGTAIHAVAQNSESALNSIKAIFTKEGVKDYTARKIQPSLEDVFVSLIEEHDVTREERGES